MTTTMDHATDAEHLLQIEVIAPLSEMTHMAVKNGAWSDPSIWASGKVPGTEANVHIPDGITVTYDVGNQVPLNIVRVDGTLEWSLNKDTEMLVETIVTTHGSTIEIGSMANPMPTDYEASITFRDTPFDATDTGKLGHGLVAFGEVDIQGAAKESHLVLNGGADAGARSIKVEGDTNNWEIGDILLLVGTGNGSRDEERTITSINGDTIELDEALSYDHQPPAGMDFDTYVGNLTRNVVFTSENPDGIRGHVMMHNNTPNPDDGSTNTVRYAEFRDMGRTDASITTGTIDNPDGRYAIHLHQTGTEVGGPSSIIEGNAVNGTPGWAIVQHSSKAMINDNIVFDAVGAGIVSEAGDETGMWMRNLVTSVAGTGRDHFLPGVEGSAYENQSRVIIQQDNIAANSEVGWNFFGREDFAEDAANPGAPKDGSHRKMFDRDELPFDPSPFDVALDHEEPPIVDFNNNTVIASGVGMRVFHRQTSDDSDTMSVIRNFDIWGGSDAVALDNYASNYEFIDSVWQGSGLGFSIMRKTSSVVFNNVDMHDFDTGYRSWGINHEVVLIDTDFHNVGNNFDLKDLLKNVSDGDRGALINYFKTNYDIDYTNPMPQIINSASLTPIDTVYFTAGSGSDLTISPGDRTINIFGTITDSVGTRNFNEYVIAKPPNGSGSSKDFEGVSLTFAASESDSQKQFTVDQFLALHGTFQKSDGTWVSPVVNWITDRLSGEQHPVIIEIKLAGFDNADLAANKLDAYPTPGIGNTDWYAANTFAHPEATDGVTEPTVVAPEPTVVEPEPTVVEPEPTVVEPEPIVFEPEPIVFEPEPTNEGEVIVGTSGRDLLVGTSGDDIIEGGGHRDKLFGGDGADTFRFNTDALDGHRDEILDFSIADGDKIDLSPIAAAYGIDTETLHGLVALKDIKPGLRVGLEIEGEFHSLAVLHDVSTKDLNAPDTNLFLNSETTDGPIESTYDDLWSWGL